MYNSVKKDIYKKKIQSNAFIVITQEKRMLKNIIKIF